MNRTALPFTLRSAAAALICLGVAGCDDDGTGPGGTLQPDDVSSIYAVCQLVFDPAGSVLPSVDIRAAAFEFPGGVRNPAIGLDPDAQRTVELSYVPKGQVNDRELRGTYTLRGSSTVGISFNTTGTDPKSLLIPDNRRMDFEFQESPRRLTMSGSVQYNVSREAYVELSGEDPQNLPATITGILMADFRTDGCGG